MSTLKAIHICNSHQPTLQPKIAKEYVFINAVRNTNNRMNIKTKKNTERTTAPIRKWGFSASNEN